MRRLACAGALLLAILGAACATAQAGGMSAGPALETPVPPPHVVQTPDDPTAPAPPENAEVAPKPVLRPATAKPATPERATPDKPEPAPPPPLQTSVNVAEAEKRVRALLQQASRDLERTDYQALNADGRAEYNTVKRFVRQAMEALQEKDVTFAEQLARKATTLAARLVPREDTPRPVSGATTPA
ncbi:MAG: hypothetical protein AB1806_10370 [Acidobacteriota bacterium]